MHRPPPSASSSHSLPAPPTERGRWLFALSLATLALFLAAAALSGHIGGDSTSPPAPPSFGAAAAIPSPSPAQAAGVLARATGAGARPGEHAPRAMAAQAIVAQPSVSQQQADARRLVDHTRRHIAARWVAGFYPIYAAAQSTFGVNWLLLASIHRQESAFSTARGTYHGLNFVHCCGGPMQFNVTNGPLTTWQLVQEAYRYGARPRAYGHMTASHPSIYDDFDSIMAAAWLLSADGARLGLDAGAWVAAYDYYGHDLTGVAYADEVLARAIGWSQHGFCINCGVSTALIEAVHAAYGAPVARALTTSAAARAQRRRAASGRSR